MSSFITFPAFRSAGDALRLLDVLSMLPDNDLVWSMYEFHGVGEPPAGMTMDEFETMVSKAPGGVRFLWKELIRFANEIDQTIDCLLVGAETERILPETLQENSEFNDFEYVVRLFDCEEWSIYFRDTDLFESVKKSIKSN